MLTLGQSRLLICALGQWCLTRLWGAHSELMEVEQMGVEGLAQLQLVPSPLWMVAVLDAVGKALLALVSYWRSGKWWGDLRPGGLTTASWTHLADLFGERRRPRRWWSWSVGGPWPFLPVPWLLIDPKKVEKNIFLPNWLKKILSQCLAFD